MIKELTTLYCRELTALKRELLAYRNEADMWSIPAGISNSAGNLAMHLVGNLRFFIGVQLGGSSYVRNRPGEFADRDVPRSELLQRIDDTISELQQTFAGLAETQLRAQYPQPLAGVRFETGDFLLHLLSHLAYHLGQLDYHRRLVTGDGSTVGTLSIPEIATAVKVGADS